MLSIEALGRHDVTPVARSISGSRCRTTSCSRRTARTLYGSSYYTGVSNIFRYELETGKLEAVTNTETGFFRPIPLGGDELIVFRYTGTGFVPARITARPIEDVSPITFLASGSSRSIRSSKPGTSGRRRRSRTTRWPRRPASTGSAAGCGANRSTRSCRATRTPPAIGVRLNFSDPLSLNVLSLTGVLLARRLAAGERARAPDGGVPAVRLARTGLLQRRRLLRPLRADQARPPRLRRGVGHRNLLIFDEPRRLKLDVSGSIAGNLDRLPEYQNVAVDVDRLYSAEATLAFADVRNSLGAVDDETGQRWSATAQGAGRRRRRRIRGSAAPTIAASRCRSATRRSGSATRPASRRGIATQPFANFFFGGFGNNYVDHADEKRYREFEAFPATPINEIGGRNFAKSTVEWNLPPWRFRRAGTPGFYASWLRPALFVSGLATNLDAPSVRRTRRERRRPGGFPVHDAVGAELTLSVGAAVAFEQDRAAARAAPWSR